MDAAQPTVDAQAYERSIATVVRRRQGVIGITTDKLSQDALVPRTTLQRHLVDGAFKPGELARVAAVLGTTPAAIAAEAEAVAA